MQKILRAFFKDFIHLFLERGEGREKAREIHVDVREMHRLLASHVSATGTPGRW